jgi:hypothetical protein
VGDERQRVAYTGQLQSPSGLDWAAERASATPPRLKTGRAAYGTADAERKERSQAMRSELILCILLLVLAAPVRTAPPDSAMGAEPAISMELTRTEHGDAMI